MKEIKLADLKGILEKRGTFFVLVVGDGCELCDEVKKGLEKFEKDYPKIEFYISDVTNDPELKMYFPVKTLPYMLYFKQGGFVKGWSMESNWEEKMKAVIDPKSVKHKVIVFSTPTCPYCTMVKNYLKEKGIEFEDVNVAADQEMARKMVERSGQMGVPQIWIDDAVVVGYDVPRINSLLGIE